MAFEVRGPLVPDVETTEELIALKHENSDCSWMWKRVFLGQRQQHSYYLYHHLNSQILNNKDICSIVEIGTGSGCLTTVLALFGQLIGARVLTVDHDPALSQRLHHLLVKKLDVTMLFNDEWSSAAITKILKHIGGEKTYVFCDGGDKVKELNFWSRSIPPGSLISVHDWGTEVTPDDVPEGLTPYREDFWNIMNIQTATWVVDEASTV